MNVEAIPVISRSNIDSECIWDRRDRLNAEAAKREDAGRGPKGCWSETSGEHVDVKEYEPELVQLAFVTSWGI